MRVRKITVGTYSYNDKSHTFCLFQVPVYSEDRPILVNFYRLNDLDVIFFENSPGYLLKSNKIPEEYFKSPSHHIKDKNGDDLLSSTAIIRAAEALDNNSLADLCRFTYEQIDQGQADETFQSVSKILNWKPPFSKTFIEIDVKDNADTKYYADFNEANDSSRNNIALKASVSATINNIQNPQNRMFRQQNSNPPIKPMPQSSQGNQNNSAQTPSNQQPQQNQQPLKPINDNNNNNNNNNNSNNNNNNNNNTNNTNNNNNNNNNNNTNNNNNNNNNMYSNFNNSMNQNQSQNQQPNTSMPSSSNMNSSMSNHMAQSHSNMNSNQNFNNNMSRSDLDLLAESSVDNW
ncbi:hypothetical protein PIROE2DRAFT_7617 [Piromyces sp. E2]|nr:hypothetical protein PIROE2DRAFT_7617 [Piromyces sp. E2]|eukprot:OUM65407.1 hypothetical protein PIROE2DRAFT_7617 [Piromyces sp. E2]